LLEQVLTHLSAGMAVTQHLCLADPMAAEPFCQMARLKVRSIPCVDVAAMMFAARHLSQHCGITRKAVQICHHFYM